MFQGFLLARQSSPHSRVCSTNFFSKGCRHFSIKAMSNSAPRQVQQKIQKGLTQLPYEVGVEIVVKLVTTSDLPVTDLMNLRSTCKFFKKISEEIIVKKSVKLSNEFPPLEWYRNPPSQQILREYSNAGNQEAEYVFAVVNIYLTRDISRAMQLLRSSAMQGYEPAICLLFVLKERISKDFKNLQQVIPMEIFNGVNLPINVAGIEIVVERIFFRRIFNWVWWKEWSDEYATQPHDISSPMYEALLFICGVYDPLTAAENPVNEDIVWNSTFHVLHPYKNVYLRYEDVINNIS